MEEVEQQGELVAVRALVDEEDFVPPSRPTGGTFQPRLGAVPAPVDIPTPATAQQGVLREVVREVTVAPMATSVPAATATPEYDAEWDLVQTVIDVAMADNALRYVTPPSRATNDFTNLDLDPGRGVVSLDSYMRRLITSFYWCWDSSGRVTDGYSQPLPCPVPAVAPTAVPRQAPASTPAPIPTALVEREVTVAPTATSVPAATATPDYNAEWDMVQTVIDVAMADNALRNVKPPSRATNDFTNLDLDPGRGVVSLDSYMRRLITSFYWCWDSSGRVTDGYSQPVPCPAPAAAPSAVPRPAATPSASSASSSPAELLIR